jgi:hypothetical protein
VRQSNGDKKFKNLSKWYDTIVIITGIVFLFNFLVLDQLVDVLPAALGDFVHRLFIAIGMIAYVSTFLISVFSLTLKDVGKVNNIILFITLIGCGILTFFVVLKLLGLGPA